MANERVNIPISEDFLIRNMRGYDVYEAPMREIMANQNHVDIRTFATESGESWTTGTFGNSSETNHLPRLKLNVIPGSIESASVTPTHPVDLVTGFASTDFISISLPSFPLSVVNTTTSFIDFTSNPEGNFTAGPTISVSFNSSIATLSNGNCEFRVERSLIESNPLVDLEKITAVRFRIQGTGSGTLTLMGLRLLDANWQQGPIDYDNWNGRWDNTVPSNGNPANPPAFGQPILWRSDDPSGEDDPRPIDSQFGIIFYTGAQEHNNTFSLFLREVSQAFLTQLDLDGTTMSGLDGKPQPDLGVSEFAPRLMTDMDRFEMEQLDTMDMFDIERIPDPVFTGWIQFTLQWGISNAITVTNSSNPGYVFNNVPSLTSNTHYLFICTLEGNNARAQIYEVNGTTFAINPSVVFDTTLINDDNLFKRRKGRVGWQATLGDNNAYIAHIRTRHTAFAEYISSPLSSLTPVKGAQLFADFTQNTELWEGFNPGPQNTKAGSSLTRDTARSTSGESYRIDNSGAVNQGFESNPLNFTDFTQAEVSFDLWYPSTLIQEAEAKGETPGIILQLMGLYQNPTFSLIMPEIIPDQWQHVSGINLANYALNQTGEYALLITQPSASAGSWWIDKINVFQRAIQWSARSVVSNPWESNFAPWTDFRELVNSNTSGILFSPQGKDLQMRARALRQDANIVGPPKLVPTYAELGRLVWPENALKGLTPPTANYPNPTQITGLEYSFTSSSTPGSGGIVLYEWTFGDGARATGSHVTHTYLAHGTYQVTLTVTDRNGQQANHTEPLVI